ncbi:MAG: hypothetical protein ACYC5M_08305 [Anaerolineae bacterium]
MATETPAVATPVATATWRATSPAPTAFSTPTAFAEPTATPGTVATTEVITYTSQELGISFRYAPEQYEQHIEVLEQGDRIYVYASRGEPSTGQWVQVFEKSASESLEQAINGLIMPGYPSENCKVITPVVPPVKEAPPSHTFAHIVVPPVPDEDDAARLARWRTCPQTYTVIGGIGYFQGDTLHPDRFLFFSIGQYMINAEEGVLWQETVRFN